MISHVREGLVCKHHSGRVYTVIELTNVGSTETDHVPTVVFIGANGRKWSRPLVEFEQKFTVIYDGTTLA